MDLYKSALTVVLWVLSLLGSIVGITLYLILFFHVLNKVHADPLMWTLYWCYVPVTVLVSVGSQVVVKLSSELTGDK